LFALDGKPTDISENDLARRNTIALLLEDWELLTIVNPEKIEDLQVSLSQIKIIGYREKDDWELVPKYNIGKKIHRE
jgi:thiamine monophosphate kinase